MSVIHFGNKDTLRLNNYISYFLFLWENSQPQQNPDEKQLIGEFVLVSDS